MQIKKLSFKNINNLKGKQEIDFTQNPLAQAGMFAIVGPTGSGKSTILDVITLALFNRIPRFKKAMTKSELEGSGSVMTRHTKDCYASIDFQIKNELYTSKWEISTNRNNKLRDYHMEIYSHSAASFLDLKRSEVPKKNEEIIGLDYDQFIKSIILSQGQFAKFLKADKNERGYLLENITGSKIYRRLGIKSFEKYKAVKSEIEIFKTRKADITLLTEEDKDQIKTTLKESNLIVEQQNQKLKDLSSAKQIKEELKKLEADWSREKGKYDLLLSQLEDFKREEAKLTTHDLASPYRGKIAVYEMAAHQLNVIEGQLSEHQTQIDNAKKQLAEVVQQMAQLTGREVNEGNFKKVMQAFESEVNLMDNDLKNIKEQGATIRLQINNLIEGFQTTTNLNLTPAISPEKAVTLLQTELNEKQSSSEDTDIEGKVVELSKTINRQKEELTQITKVAELKVRQEEIIAEQQHKSKEISALKEQLSSQSKKEKETTENISKLATHKTELQVQKEKAIKLFSLADYRKELKTGEPCPLCGSESHPYSEHLPDAGDGYDIEIKKTTELILDLEKKQKEIAGLIVANSTKIESHTARAQELALRQKETEQKLTVFFYQNKLLDLDKEALLDKIKLTSKQIAEAEKNLADIISRKEMHTLLKKYRQLAEIATKYKALHQKRISKYKGEKVSTICNELQDRFQDCTTSIVSNQQAATNARMKRKTEMKNLKVTDQKLKPIFDKIGLASISGLKSLILNDNEVNSIKERKITLSTQQTKLETSLKAIKEGLTEYRSKDTADLTLEKLSVDLIQLEQNQKDLLTGIGQLTEQLLQDDKSLERIASFQTELEKLEKEQEKWALLHAIIGDAQGNKFANYAQGLTLQNLVVLANKRLSRLSDRYLLIQPESDGLLQIIDLYQGETKRAVSTLSGGESFMVSLALALSLSDMASKNVALDSLFIDEGFGTLDLETLDMAMNTLEKLQTESQKTVGVISHVEALKERIHVQIRLVKNSQGYSKIVLEG